MKKSNEAGDNLTINLPCRDAQKGSRSPDTLSRDGAMALARQLQQYWHDKGYPAARFWAEPVGERFAKVGTYEIKSGGVQSRDGLPPRYRDDPG
jgi:hypothetical protein